MLRLRRFCDSLFIFIRGPTHITQTDIWVSCGGTISLFKRRGDWVSGNWCREEVQKPRSRHVRVEIFPDTPTITLISSLYSISRIPLLTTQSLTVNGAMPKKRVVDDYIRDPHNGTQIRTAHTTGGKTQVPSGHAESRSNPKW